MTRKIAPANLLFQTDGQWWSVWTPAGDPVRFDDAYLTSDDLSDLDAPRAGILADVFARLNEGQPFPVTIVPRGKKIGPDGWPTDECSICGAMRCECVPYAGQLAELRAGDPELDGACS